MIRSNITLRLSVLFYLGILLLSCAQGTTHTRNIAVENIRSGQTVNLFLSDGDQITFQVSKKDNNFIFNGSDPIPKENIVKSELIVDGASEGSSEFSGFLFFLGFFN